MSLNCKGDYPDVQESFAVDNIIGCRKEDDHFLVNWTCYPPTWEPGATLRDEVPDLIDLFCEEHDATVRGAPLRISSAICFVAAALFCAMLSSHPQ
jgi:hypothetical protein